MLAVVFDAVDTLAQTQHVAGRFDAASAAALAAVAEAVRPYAGTPRVLRELESLNVPMAIAGTGPAWLTRRIAEVVWFRGDVLVASEAEMANAMIAWAALPADRIWFVTSRADAAAAARAAGINPIVVDANGDSIGEVLEALRAPYTRAALNLRYLFRTVVEVTDPGAEAAR